MNYFAWHYLEVWPKIFILWRNSILFPYYYFSIPLHLKTLFSPWKKQLVKKRIGFHIDDVLGVISFNIMSRIIGAIVKTATVIYGLVIMFLALVIWIIPVTVWPLIPIITLPFYLSRNPSKDKEAQYYLKSASGDIERLVHLVLNQPESLFVFAHLGLSMEQILSPSANENHKTDLSKLNVPTFAKLLQKLSEVYMPFNQLLMANNLTGEDVYQTAIWYEKAYEKKTPHLLFDLAKIRNLQGIGHNWSYGYTVELDKYAKDLTRVIPAFPILVRRDMEIGALQRILLKTEGNNALVVGEPGVARRLLVEILAYRILTGNVEPKLAGKRILSLNMHALASAKPNILEVKGLAEELLSEANFAGNVIIFIDEIDKYLSEGSGRIDLSDVIVKFAESSVGIIGVTTPFAYHKFIQTNSTLSTLFEKVDVQVLDKDAVLDVLEISISPVLEKKYGITITYPAIIKTIKDSDRYITDTPFPAKANNLLDEACVWKISHPERSEGSRRDQNDILVAQDIDTFLSGKMHMPLGDLQKAETEKLSNLENLMHERIVNQEEAIRVIAASMRRARLSIGNPNKPIGSFLFLGPTGVGKTETAKALAAVYFGSEEKLSRFDMSQYQRIEGIERLIGSSITGSPGELTSKLSDQPFSVLLLDEFEKADREIYNLFLTLLDEGYITDATGKRVSAKNSIIIATSNAAAEFIREKINQGMHASDLRKELLEYVQKEKIFSPELINRFDQVVVFTPLSEGQLREVAKLQLAELNRRLKPKEISVAITRDLVERLAFLGFDPQFGARAMKRTIQENIEDQVAQKILRGEVKKGERIQIQL